MTATMVEAVSDTDVPASACCGSAARLDDGSWVMSWGGTRVIGEFGPEGDRHFVAHLQGAARGRSASPTAWTLSKATALDIDELRAGMDAIGSGRLTRAKP